MRQGEGSGTEDALCMASGQENFPAGSGSFPWRRLPLAGSVGAQAIFFYRHMRTSLPFLLEITLLVIGLPLAFAWALALAVLASLPLRGRLRKMRAIFSSRPGAFPGS